MCCCPNAAAADSAAVLIARSLRIEPDGDVVERKLVRLLPALLVTLLVEKLEFTLAVTAAPLLLLPPPLVLVAPRLVLVLLSLTAPFLPPPPLQKLPLLLPLLQLSLLLLLVETAPLPPTAPPARNNRLLLEDELGAAKSTGENEWVKSLEDETERGANTLSCC